MTIWEKAIVNIQKGSRRMGIVAAAFSERVKTEIAIVRLKIRIDDVQKQIDEQHRLIGKRAVTAAQEAASATLGSFFEEPEIRVAAAELEARSRERADLDDDLRNAYRELKETAETPEDAK